MPEETPEITEDDARRTLNAIVQKLQDKTFLRANDINLHNAQKILLLIETISVSKNKEWVDGSASMDGQTMPGCPKHGVAPIHFCMVGRVDKKKRKPSGQCQYFNGQDAVHGRCTAPCDKQFPAEEKYTWDEAFRIESNYRKRPKEVVGDLSSISATAKAQADAKKKTRKRGVPQQKQEKDFLPGDPKELKTS